MIESLIGLGAILLGMKGFTLAGLPLTKKRRLTGKSARVVGVICILFGVAVIAEGAYSLYRMTHPVQGKL